MSDTNVTDQDERDIPSLREAAKKGKAALDENARLKRELMFAKAGIDTDNKIGKMLFQTWEGDDLDALRDEATSLGLIGAPPASTPPAGATPDDADQMRHRENLSSGTVPPGQAPQTPHPMDDALTGFQSAVKNGVRREDAQLAAIDKLIVAGAKKDPRVLYDPSAAR